MLRMRPAKSKGNQNSPFRGLGGFHASREVKKKLKQEQKPQVGDLRIMPKTRTSVWGNKNKSKAASERRFMIIEK